MQVLAGELIRLAHHVSGGPDAAPFAAALRAALAIVQPGHACASCSLAPALDDLAGSLVMLADRAEWMAERASSFTTTPQRT